MSAFFEKIRLIFKDRVLRRRIIMTLALLAVFRLLSVIPIPSIDTSRLASFFTGNQLLGLFNIFSGGSLSKLSIVMLGVGPYITASIIMQLLTMIIPSLKAMYQEEGEAGRKKFIQYSRMLTVPLAIFQGWAFLVLLERSSVIPAQGAFDMVRNLSIVTAGSMLLVWLGERISEYGIGNGTSLIILGGIVAALPQAASQQYFKFDVAQLPVYLALLVVSLLVIYGVVVITEAERPIPVTYAKRVRGNKVYGGVSTYIPLRLNQAGVIPIIFALSLLLFPQVILQFAVKWFTNPSILGASEWLLGIIKNQWVYGILYFLLVFAFTYFYTAVTFDPNQISENLQKNGAFIPGVRPGQSTAVHISHILTRLTMFGALFLGIIAVLPLVAQGLAPNELGSISIGGTSLLIVVSVVIDLMKKTDAQLSMKEY